MVSGPLLQYVYQLSNINHKLSEHHDVVVGKNDLRSYSMIYRREDSSRLHIFLLGSVVSEVPEYRRNIVGVSGHLLIPHQSLFPIEPHTSILA